MLAPWFASALVCTQRYGTVRWLALAYNTRTVRVLDPALACIQTGVRRNCRHIRSFILIGSGLEAQSEERKR